MRATSDTEDERLRSLVLHAVTGELAAPLAAPFVARLLLYWDAVEMPRDLYEELFVALESEELGLVLLPLVADIEVPQTFVIDRMSYDEYSEATSKFPEHALVTPDEGSLFLVSREDVAILGAVDAGRVKRLARSRYAELEPFVDAVSEGKSQGDDVTWVRTLLESTLGDELAARLVAGRF